MASRYLLHFVQEHIPFRWPEFSALASKNNCNFKLISHTEHIQTRPYILIELLDQHVEGLINCAKESYLLKDLYELWAHSSVSLDDLALIASKSREFVLNKPSHSQPDESFKVNCESFNSKLTQEVKVDMIRKMFFIKDFPSKLDLNNPKQLFCIFEMNQRNPSSGTIIHQEYYFGRHLAKSDRSSVYQFSLKNRSFIANTSMDALISLIASNVACVRTNDLVCDPFVGSGSLLVAAAYKGGYVFGADIDWLLLHGKSKPSRAGQTYRKTGEGVRSNLRQYNLENMYLDVMVSDISRQPLSDRFIADCIITDPPYGIRESSERIGKRNSTHGVSDDVRVRYPCKIGYEMQELYVDLLEFSVHHLRIGGRLVYFLPIACHEDSQKFDEFIPSHPSLQLISFCEQPLNKRNWRLMVIMEKYKQVSDDESVTIPNALRYMNFRESYFLEKSAEGIR